LIVATGKRQVSVLLEKKNTLNDSSGYFLTVVRSWCFQCSWFILFSIPYYRSVFYL